VRPIRRGRIPALLARFRTGALLFVLAVGGVLATVAACTPSIGDKCQVSTDCSLQGDRLCDTSQPQGYCTQLNCQGGSCADNASCVLFGSAIPGCGYNDRSGPFGSRLARSFCTAQCSANSDCRAGYVCADPRSSPWNAVILDNDQTKLGCLPVPAPAVDAGASTGTAPVCGPAAPPITPIDAGPAIVHEAGVDVPPLFSVPPGALSGDAALARD
jgi:hypothetical protein